MKYSGALIEKLIHGDLMALSAELNAAHLRHLYFKGTALAYTLYEIPSQRARHDTDIFISAQDKHAVEKILLNLGFHFELISGEDEIAHQKAYIKNYPWCQVVIDLHWQISNRPLFRKLLNFEEAWARAQAAPRLGGAYVFGLVHAQLIAIIHPFMHHHGEQDPVWWQDQLLLGKLLSEEQWLELLYLAEQRKVLRLLLSQLNRLNREHQLDLPRCCAEALAARPLYEKSWRYFRSNSRSVMIMDLLHSSSWVERIRHLRAVAFPSPAYMQVKYGLKNSWVRSLMLPVLYLHRIVSGLLRF